jgi:exodeoxyribonuclease VII small subunit
MQTKEINYEEAVNQLEAMAQKMENGEFELDELVAQLKKAQELIKLCSDRLRSTEGEIQKILNPERQ